MELHRDDTEIFVLPDSARCIADEKVRKDRFQGKKERLKRLTVM